MLMHTREGTTIVTQQEKVTNETRQQINNLFQWLCSVRSFSVFEKASLVICDGQFSFSHRTSQVELRPLLLATFSKSSTLPWQNRQHNASRSFSWSFSPPTIDFQNSPSSDFYMARDLSLAWPLGRLAAWPLKRLAPLAKKLVKLDSAVVLMGFSGALSSFSHFSWL